MPVKPLNLLSSMSTTHDGFRFDGRAISYLYICDAAGDAYVVHYSFFLLGFNTLFSVITIIWGLVSIVLLFDTRRERSNVYILSS